MRSNIKPIALCALVVGLTVSVYAFAVLAGMHAGDLSFYRSELAGRAAMTWKAPGDEDIPAGPLGESIRLGRLLFNETPVYASAYTNAKVRCQSCHLAGGTRPYASPVVGLPALFPMYNERAGRDISLEDRIQECFVRSQNGRPLDPAGPEMRALKDYIVWLSQPEPGRQPFEGRGLIKLPDLQPDPVRGQAVYAAQCAGCHGDHGQGNAPQFPPLWGEASFNDGAGMNGIRKMAAFVQHNMPHTRPGILTPQQAYDVASYIHMQPRPAFNPAYKRY